jgi:hypothetical protein
MTAPAERTPSAYWRGVIRGGMWRAPADDAALRAYCDEVYADEKQTLAATLARGGSPRDIEAARVGVFVVALALLTYGRLDVVADVLDNLPPHPHPARRGLAGAIRALLPIPAHLAVLDAPREALAWIRANEARLRWDDDAGRFVLVA